jgi:hypothetical protein
MKSNSEDKMAVQATLYDLLNDLRFAEQSLRQFEGRYQLSSEIFYELFCKGLLDDGQYLEEFAEWAGHYKLKLKRESALKEFSQERLTQLRRQSQDDIIRLIPQSSLPELGDGVSTSFP